MVGMSEFGKYAPPEAFQKQTEDQNNSLFERPETTSSRRRSGNYTAYGTHSLEQFPNNKESAPSGDVSKPSQGNVGDNSNPSNDSTNAQGQNDATTGNQKAGTDDQNAQQQSKIDADEQNRADAERLANVRLELEEIKQRQQRDIHDDFRPG